MHVILEKFRRYFSANLFFWNYWLRIKKDNIDKINVAWYGPFPPAPNGAAVLDAWIAKELAKYDINLFLIPFGKCIDKRMFKDFNFAKLSLI